MRSGPTLIRNRDIMLLARVLYTMQDVRATERKRLWQQDRLWNITQKITGMPGGGGKAGGLEDHFGEIAEMEERYAAECAQYIRELKQAEAILNGIENRELRTFVTLKYVMNTPNAEIMSQLNMGRRAFERATRSIEQAQDMAHVRWDKRYILW